MFSINQPPGISEGIVPLRDSWAEEADLLVAWCISSRAERASLIQDTKPLVNDTMTKSEKIDLLREVFTIRIPQEERAILIQDTLPLLSNRTSGRETYEILSAMHTIPHAERARLIQDIRPLFTDKTAWYDKSPLLKGIYKIPQEERASLIQDTLPLFSNTMFATDKVELLHKMREFPQAERAALIQDTLPLLSNRMNWADIVNLLEAMRKIPQTERASLIQDTLPLFKETMPGDNKAELLRILHTIPQAGRAGLIQDTAPLFTATMNGYEKARLLEVMGRVVQTERARLIQDIKLLVSTTKYKRDELLEAMRKVPQAERASLIEDTTPLFTSTMEGLEKGELLKIMHAVPQTERASLIEDTKPLFTDTMYWSIKADLLKTVQVIPQEKRGSLIQKARQAFSLRMISGDDLLLFYLLPDSLRTQEKCSRPFLFDQECRAAIIASIEQAFLSDKTNPRMLLKLADFVQKEQVALELHEEHAVVQQAVEILCAEAIVGENNPFSLYKRLQALAKEPFNFQPPESEIEGKKTAFCLEALQASGKAFEITRSELPQDATKANWEQLVTGLKTKIETDAQAKKHLEEVYTTWSSLWNSSLSDLYLSGLLELSGEQVSIVEAQFRALLHYLLSKDTQVKPGEVFSEQEEALIKQGMSIQNCTGGKKEGIALAYALLPQAFRYQAQGLEGGCPKETAAKKFLAGIVQQTLAEQFSGTNVLMQELVGSTIINQAAHQAIYLKNLLGPFVGLNHKVAFDRHTGALYNSLIALPREKAAEIFFRHMTPEVLVQALVRAVNNDFRTCRPIVAPLVTSEEMSAGWEWDEELDIPTRLNTLGALQILQTAGYLR